MSDYRIKVSTAPTSEPVTVDDVKLACHIDHSTEDTLITGWIKTARELAEGYTRRAFMQQTIRLTYDEFPETPILLPRAPAVSLTSIAYYDTDNTAAMISASDLITDFDSEPAQIELAYGIDWPSVVLRPMSSVKIEYVAGYGSSAVNVPQRFKDAILLWCTWRNENRTAEVSAPEQFWSLLRPDRLMV